MRVYLRSGHTTADKTKIVAGPKLIIDLERLFLEDAGRIPGDIEIGDYFGIDDKDVAGEKLSLGKL